MNDMNTQAVVMPEEITQAESVVVAEEKPKPYTLRKLEAQDMFVMFRIISAIGINEFKLIFEAEGLKDIFNKLMSGAGKAEVMKDGEGLIATGASVVLDFAQIIFTNISKCEREVYQLLSNLSGMKVEKIRTLGAAVFAEMVIDVIKKGEFRDFIQVVSGLFK